MTRRPIMLLIAAAVAPLAGCTTEPGTTPASRAPAAAAVGEPVNCVSTGSIDNTRVHDDRTIDFHLLGGDVYRNTLPHRCPSLGFEERFAYRTNSSQLCSVDVIAVLYSDGQRGAGCGLGPFLPVKINKD